MKSDEKKKLKKKLKGHEKAIRAVLNEWDPIPGSPENEYDCLVHKILTMLYQGVSKNELESMLQSELIDHFGLDASREKVKVLVEKVWTLETN